MLQFEWIFLIIVVHQVGNVYAKEWSDRKEGMEQMLAQLEAMTAMFNSGGGAGDIFDVLKQSKKPQQQQTSSMEMEMLQTAMPVLRRALQDPLFQANTKYKIPKCQYYD